MFPEKVSGRVTNVAGSTITLNQRRGTSTVLVSSDTKYYEKGTTPTGVSDGQHVVASGLPDTTTPGALDAQVVAIFSPAAQPQQRPAPQPAPVPTTTEVTPGSQPGGPLVHPATPQTPGAPSATSWNHSAPSGTPSNHGSSGEPPNSGGPGSRGGSSGGSGESGGSGGQGFGQR